MKKISLLLLSLLLWTGCIKDNPQQEPEKEKTEEQQTEEQQTEEQQNQNVLKKPVKITVTGNQYGSNKEILFSYDEQGRIQKIQKWLKLTDPVVFEYIIDYSLQYPKVTITQYQSSGSSTTITDIVKKENIRDKKVINYGENYTQGDYNLQFTFEAGRFYEKGVILFDSKGNIIGSDTGSSMELHYTQVKYDDKNHPFKNINVFLNPSFLDFDDSTGNWDWSGQETFLRLPIYPYEKAMKYTNNLVEYNYLKRNWNNLYTDKTEKRSLVYDTDDFPTEITLSDGTKYVIEYNKKAPNQTSEPSKEKNKKPKRITQTDANGELWDEYLFHYDDKGRLNKIVQRYVSKSYTYTYNISYQGDSNHIAEVTYLEDQINQQFVWTATYSYGNGVLLFVEKQYKYPWSGSSTYKYEYIDQKIYMERLVNDNSKYTSPRYDDKGNISCVKTDRDDRNDKCVTIFDTKNHPFKNVGIAFRDVAHFSIFMHDIVPMTFVNNPIEWTSFNDKGSYTHKRTDMKYDDDDFLIEFKENNRTTKIEYTE